MVLRTFAVIATLLLLNTHGLGMLSLENKLFGAPQDGALAAESAPVAGPDAGAIQPPPDSVDGLLKRIFDRIETQQLDVALELVEQLVQRFPNYRLGHLIKGDLLLAQISQPVASFGALAPADRHRPCRPRLWSGSTVTGNGRRRGMCRAPR